MALDLSAAPSLDVNSRLLSSDIGPDGVVTTLAGTSSYTHSVFDANKLNSYLWESSSDDDPDENLPAHHRAVFGPPDTHLLRPTKNRGENAVEMACHAAPLADAKRILIAQSIGKRGELCVRQMIPQMPARGNGGKKSKRNRPRNRRGNPRGNGPNQGMPMQRISHAPSVPFASTMYVRFSCEADYKIPIAAASVTSGAVKLNSPWLPFRPGGSTAFPSYTFLGPATEATLLPTGWSTLANANVYLYYKVMRARIALRVQSANSANNTVVTVVPADSAFSPASIYVVRTLPYARQCTFSASKPHTGVGRDGFFHMQIDPAKLIGLTRVEGKADLLNNAGVYNTDPLIVNWWQIYLQTNDLDVTATTASLLQVRVQYDVQLYGLRQLPVT